MSVFCSNLFGAGGNGCFCYGLTHWEISNGRWRAKTCVAIVLRQISKAWKRGPGNTFGKGGVGHEFCWSWVCRRMYLVRRVGSGRPLVFLCLFSLTISLSEDGPFLLLLGALGRSFLFVTGLHLRTPGEMFGDGITLSWEHFSRASWGESQGCFTEARGMTRRMALVGLGLGRSKGGITLLGFWVV
ncbi:hypothetical protein CMUS01_12524 [Colletotrichum musicola]|uniref:Uncharacterized protein n=1 Tax=Colletotrichum musicola TaxID=2175873 RepID=A0A8H6JLC5_9PEZI|nr:hypothetical protein CMUS01_12524 [Colletotrichum musicola]